MIGQKPARGKAQETPLVPRLQNSRIFCVRLHECKLILIKGIDSDKPKEESTVFVLTATTKSDTPWRKQILAARATRLALGLHSPGSHIPLILCLPTHPSQQPEEIKTIKTQQPRPQDLIGIQYGGGSNFASRSRRHLRAYNSVYFLC